MINFFHRAFVLIGILLVFQGCRKIENIDTNEWNPEVAVPLFTSTFSVVDLLDDAVADANLVTDDMNALTFVYPSAPFTLDEAILEDYVPKINFVMNDTLYDFPYTNSLGSSIDTLITKKGVVQTAVYNQTGEDVTFRFWIDEFTIDGNRFDTTFLVPNSTLPKFTTGNTAGYSLVPDNDIVHFNYAAVGVNSGQPVNLNGSVLVILDSMQISYAEGYFGKVDYPVPRDSIEIDVFKIFEQGALFFEEPKITITVNNSFGIPTNAYFSTLDAITFSGTRIPVSNAILNQGMTFGYPTLNQVGQSISTQFIVDKTNSNIEDIVGQSIHYIDYELFSTANPDADPTIRGFATDSSAIAVDLLLELPVYGRSNNFTVYDTLDIDLSSNDSQLSHISFRLHTENELPLDVQTQIYFVAANLTIIDSLNTDYSKALIAAAPVDSDGNSIGISEATTDFEIPEDRYNRIATQAQKVILKAAISTIDDGIRSVRVNADDNLTMKLGVKAGF